MDPNVASAIARSAHVGQLDRFGGGMVDHVSRVASSVPANARSLAWLHDVLEHSGTTLGQLRSEGLSPLEEEALQHLTRRPGEPYEAYTLRLAFAPGDAGRLARIVKRADLDDHMATAPPSADAPPYAWARRHIDARVA